MTKLQTKANNQYALDLWNMAQSVINQRIVTKAWTKRLCYCRADVTCYEYANKDSIYILRSYNTDVAVVIINSGCIYGVDMLRYVYGYTSTSAQHIAKFFNHYVDYKARIQGKETLRLRYYR